MNLKYEQEQLIASLDAMVGLYCRTTNVEHYWILAEYITAIELLEEFHGVQYDYYKGAPKIMKVDPLAIRIKKERGK